MKEGNGLQREVWSLLGFLGHGASFLLTVRPGGRMERTHGCSEMKALLGIHSIMTCFNRFYPVAFAMGFIRTCFLFPWIISSIPKRTPLSAGQALERQRWLGKTSFSSAAISLLWLSAGEAGPWRVQDPGEFRMQLFLLCDVFTQLVGVWQQSCPHQNV